MSTPVELDFPPLLSGISVGSRDPFLAAVQAARADGDPGVVHYAEDTAQFRAAVTLAPEEPLGTAMGAVVAVALGMADALGALAPPEVAVQFDWPDRIKVNGGVCGEIKAAASTHDASAEPDWLVVGVTLAMRRDDPVEPGAQADVTDLAAEGCGEIAVPVLLETWSRHMLLWLHIYMSDGFAPLHEAWRGKLDGIGTDVAYPETGHFVGLDERGGMVLRAGTTTRILPLTDMLETP